MTFARDGARVWHTVIHVEGRTAITRCSTAPIPFLLSCEDPKKVEYVKPIFCEACANSPELVIEVEEEPEPPPPPPPPPIPFPKVRRPRRTRALPLDPEEVTTTPGSGDEEEPEPPAADVEAEAPGGRSMRIGSIYAGRWLDELNPPPEPKPYGRPRKNNVVHLQVVHDDPPWIKLGITRDQWRSRRHHEVRATSINTKRLSQASLAATAEEYPEDVERPRTRGDCENGERPCPFVSCTHHLYLDVSPRTGAIKLNFPDKEVDELLFTCALDVADRGGATLEIVAEAMNLTRERVRQIEFSIKRRIGPRFEPLRRDILER